MKFNSGDISGYPVKAYKFIIDMFLSVPFLIITSSLRSGLFPSKFKTAKVVPIHKINLKTYVNLYRPISVLPLYSKISERAVHNQVYKFIEKSNLFTKSQFRFNPGKVTFHAIMELLEYVYKGKGAGE